MDVEQIVIYDGQHQTCHGHGYAKALVVVGIEREAAEETADGQEPQKVGEHVEQEAHECRTAGAKGCKAAKGKERNQQEAGKVAAGQEQEPFGIDVHFLNSWLGPYSASCRHCSAAWSAAAPQSGLACQEKSVGPSCCKARKANVVCSIYRIPTCTAAHLTSAPRGGAK